MERSIFCNACGESALTYDTDDTSVSTLDGKVCPCASCAILGRISCDYEHERGYVKFFVLDRKELSHVEFPIMVDAYEASQKRIDELYTEVAKLRSKLAAEGILG